MAGYVCSAFIGRCGLKKFEKNPLVVLGVHIFSGAAPRAVFVPPTGNEKGKT